MIGATLGRYRVRERLGSGGGGEVYLADDTLLQRPVALKLRGAADSDAGPLREARAASALSHPAVAVVYEVGEAEFEGRRRSFIAMEYVRGQTLAARLRDGPAGVEEAVDLVLQVAEALAAAHDAGIVHRDVKPSNVMVTESGRVKVLDFGLARQVPAVDVDAATRSDWERALAGRGALLGTLAYMSPEQALGREVDARSDVFSLGVLLYELLAGQPPFRGGNAVELIDALLHQEPPPLAREGRAVDADLEAIVRRMLAKDREARTASMEDARAQLAAWRGGTRGLAAAEPRTFRVAVLGFANITRGPEDDWLGTGVAETLAADLKDAAGVTVIARERLLEAARRLGLAEADEARGRELGHAVDADYVVGGGYQRLADQVRLTARITDVRRGVVAHTVKLDGTMASIFGLQDRLAAEVATALSPAPPSAAGGADETQVVEAYASYAKGLINLRAESLDALDRAIHFFERAVALDPSYARAYAQLGNALALKASYLGLPELHEQAVARLSRALELQPALAEAWRELGSALVYLRREDEGIDAVERALALDPSDASGHSTLGRAYFIGKGDFSRAARHLETALRLNPNAGWSALQLAHCCAYLRDFERGRVAARLAIRLQEAGLSGKEGLAIVGGWVRLGHLLALEGRHAEAQEEYAREQAFLTRADHALKARVFIELQTRVGASRLALGDAAAGRAPLDLAIDAFERRVRMGNDEGFTRYYAAVAYALRGDLEAALDSLERAARDRPALTIARARLEPHFAALAGQPRFHTLVTPASS
jgi:serine/threonine-protein kinase